MLSISASTVRVAGTTRVASYKRLLRGVKQVNTIEQQDCNLLVLCSWFLIMADDRSNLKEIK